MLAYLFPGQGSQTRGMGAGLFDEFPEMTKQADRILGYSIKTLCLEDPNQLLNLTQFTQPALYTVNALMYYKKIRNLTVKPDYTAGHSLGEYNALLAAEVFDFPMGLHMVKKRGELMSKISGGAMAAVIGLTRTDLQTLLKQHELASIGIANENSFLQIVISGLQDDILRAQKILEKMPGVKCILLKVSGAFHSLQMLSAQQQFAEYLDTFHFAVPSLPVLANIDTLAYHPAIIQHNLAQQITHTVQWVGTIQYLLNNADITLEEIGPGNVLTGLTHRIKTGQ
jgi:polyketide biosynthesis malonyl-CoA-[acyl-carrier-protein] transacylase